MTFYSKILTCDIANGSGVRVSVFFSGCRHHCNGCFNRECWNFEYGEPFVEEDYEVVLEALSPDYISGITILGGEPLEPENQLTVWSLLKEVKEKFPQKTVWLYTGFDYEHLTNDRCATDFLDPLLDMIDVMVDGKFEIDKADPSLKFRGSSNQRLIDVKESRKIGKVVLLEG